MAYLGIDVGTNSCKAVLLTQDGEIVFSGSRNYKLVLPGALCAELPPQTVLQSVLSLLQEAAARSESIEKIQAVSFSVLGEAVTPIDSRGEPLANTLVSMDYRGIEECRKIPQLVDIRTLYAQTGQPCNPMYPVSKILWWREHRPDIYARVWKFLCWEDFLSFKLCGKPYMSFSLASRTMLFNPFTKDWSDNILSALQLDRELFAELFPSAQVIGEVIPVVSSKVGLPAGTVVVTGGWDQACAALGAGLTTGGILLDNFGTTIFLGLLLHRLMQSQIDHDFCEAGYQLNTFFFDETLLLNGGTLSGGILLKWFHDQIKSELTEHLSQQGKDGLRFLMENLSLEPAFSFFIPSFTGSGTPFANPDLRGGILNLDYRVDYRDIFKALLESLCFEVKRNIDFLERKLGQKIDRVLFTGGGSQSPFFCGLKSCILEREIVTPSIHDVSALGAALLAAAGVDGWDKTFALIEHLSSSLSRYGETNTKRSSGYRAKYQTYCRLLEKFPEIALSFQQSV